SLGARFKGKHVGTFGGGGTFSFFFSHHISTMEGGAIITNCEKHANDLRSMRAHGWIRDRSDRDQIKHLNADANIDDRWLFVLPGFNLRPTEIQGAIGQVQLSRIDGYIKDRKGIANHVASVFSDINDLKVIGHELSGEAFDCSWMNIPIEIRPEASANKQQIVQIFEDAGFETRPIIAGNFCLHPVGELLNSKGLHRLHIGGYTQNMDQEYCFCLGGEF
ncbi:MAG: DegT/DnrJ/EryC1/StrS family aminotransferase, partial [Alphaproteobacteria bacterium]|nr:DegT/DnrJ/EryC1/StrS family aminotransferase [Alphaproteobacteria bacterium]